MTASDLPFYSSSTADGEIEAGMGAFIDNLHVRDVEQDALTAALRDLALGPAYISTDPGRVWTSVYPKACEQQEGGSPQIFVESLSERLSRPVIGFTVHDSDVFWYWLFDNGVIVDTYDSAPNYFEGGSKIPSGGNSLALQPYCLQGSTTAQIDLVLRPSALEKIGGETDESAWLRVETDKLVAKLRKTYPAMAKARGADLPPLKVLEEQARARMAQKHDLLARIAGANTMQSGRSGLELSRMPTFAEDIARSLAGILGISAQRADASFSYIAEGQADADHLVLVDGPSA